MGEEGAEESKWYKTRLITQRSLDKFTCLQKKGQFNVVLNHLQVAVNNSIL